MINHIYFRMKIFCIGRNYVEHVRELENEVPTEPLVFMKPATALLTDNKPFYHPNFSQNIHFEVEIVLKISKNGKSIIPQFAKDYYNEIGLGIDFTARDLQDTLKKQGHPWEKAKAFDHSAVVGTFYDIAELEMNHLHFQLFKNEVLVQDGDVKKMIYGFDDLVSHVSTYFTLQKGDLIFTGTPAGVGKISIGDTYKGFLNDKINFECTIK